MIQEEIVRENSRLKKQVDYLLKYIKKQERKAARLRRKLRTQRALVDEIKELWRAEMRTNRHLVDRLEAQQDPVDKAIERLHAAAVSLREQSAKERQRIKNLYGNNG